MKYIVVVLEIWNSEYDKWQQTDVQRDENTNHKPSEIDFKNNVP